MPLASDLAEISLATSMARSRSGQKMRVAGERQTRRLALSLLLFLVPVSGQGMSCRKAGWLGWHATLREPLSLFVGEQETVCDTLRETAISLPALAKSVVSTAALFI